MIGMLRVPAGDPLVLTVMMMMMIAMLRVPAGDPLVLTVMMMMIGMLRVPAGDPVVLTVMMMMMMMMVAINALVLVTPIGVRMLSVCSISSTFTCTLSCGSFSGSAPSGSENEVCAFKAAESS